MPFGPNNAHQLNNERVGWVRIPVGKSAEFFFAAASNYENACCIYPHNSDFKIHEAGNYNRRLTPFRTAVNNTGQDIFLRVTGWHKKGRPSGSLPWFQSPIERKFFSETSVAYGFEDAYDHDFEDMLVHANII